MGGKNSSKNDGGVGGKKGEDLAVRESKITIANIWKSGTFKNNGRSRAKGAKSSNAGAKVIDLHAKWRGKMNYCPDTKGKEESELKGKERGGNYWGSVRQGLGARS